MAVIACGGKLTGKHLLASREIAREIFELSMFLKPMKGYLQLDLLRRGFLLFFSMLELLIPLGLVLKLLGGYWFGLLFP